MTAHIPQRYAILPCLPGKEGWFRPGLTSHVTRAMTVQGSSVNEHHSQYALAGMLTPRITTRDIF